MAELTPEEQQELQNFVQEHFTQEDIATITALIAMWLKVDIRGLTLKEGMRKIEQAIQNMDTNEVNQKIVDGLMENMKTNKKSASTGKGEGATVKSRKPKDFVSPIDKLAQTVFDSRKNPQFYSRHSVDLWVGDKNKKPVSITVSVDITELKKYISFSNDTMLAPYNRAIHDAVISLYDAGNTHFTPDMVYHFLNGNSRNDKAPEGFRKSLDEALTKLMRTIITIDAGEEAEAFNLKDFQYKGYVLPLTYTRATINGQECECWKILDRPPLLALAERKSQINRGAANLLDTGLNVTPDNVVITHYLLEQIITMQNDHSDRNNIILYDTLYEYLGIDAPTKATRRKIQERIRKKVKCILDAWVKAGFISGYGEQVDRRKITGLYIRYTKHTK